VLECVFALGTRTAPLPWIFQTSSTLLGLLLHLETTAKLLKLLKGIYTVPTDMEKDWARRFKSLFSQAAPVELSDSGYLETRLVTSVIGKRKRWEARGCSSRPGFEEIVRENQRRLETDLSACLRLDFSL
jgi:hypothetical protein